MVWFFLREFVIAKLHRFEVDNTLKIVYENGVDKIFATSKSFIALKKNIENGLSFWNSDGVQVFLPMFSGSELKEKIEDMYETNEKTFFVIFTNKEFGPLTYNAF